MPVDQLFIAVAVVLLNLTGTPAIAYGQSIYLIAQERSVSFQIGPTDYTVLLLLDVAYVFLIWVFTVMRGGLWGLKRSLTLGIAGLVTLLAGTGLRIFLQTYALVAAGVLTSGATAAGVELVGEVGLLANCLVLGILTSLTVLVVGKNHNAKIVGKRASV